MPYNEAIADQVHTFARHARNQDVWRYCLHGQQQNVRLRWGSKADNIMVRIGADAYEDALKRKGPRPTIMKDRPIKGYIDLDSEGRA